MVMHHHQVDHTETHRCRFAARHVRERGRFERRERKRKKERPDSVGRWAHDRNGRGINNRTERWINTRREENGRQISTME